MEDKHMQYYIWLCSINEEILDLDQSSFPRPLTATPPL